MVICFNVFYVTGYVMYRYIGKVCVTTLRNHYPLFKVNLTTYVGVHTSHVFEAEISTVYNYLSVALRSPVHMIRVTHR